MVSTRQMSTGNNSANMNSSLEESNCLRPVVTRQSSVGGNINMPPSSSSPSTSLLAVGIITNHTIASTSARQTQAFKSFPNTTGSNVITTTTTQQPIIGSGTVVGDQQTTSLSSPPINLLDLPEEVLYTILSYVGFKKIGQLRVVSHKMNDVCMHMLNSTFSKLITKTYNRFQAIKANMPRRESARRNHPLACECDIIETCYMRLSLLQMTFGKHIERGHCCFFPGAILDEVYTILNYIKNTPCLERPYRVTDELFDLSTMAMEYFRDRIEPTLPGIAYFNKDFFAHKLPTTTKRPLVIASDLTDNSSSLPSPPQSNMVLRKGIRKIKQGMKIYNNQLSVLRNELRTCKRKSAEQGKQIAEQQKLMAEQRKQTLEYANRLDENDKKNEEMARKFSTLLQELNKCKTELQYWRSKSPAIPTCATCGQKVTPTLPAEDYQALINQGVKPEDIILNLKDTDNDSDLSMNDSGCNNLSLSNEFVFPDETTTAKLLAVNTASRNLKRQHYQMNSRSPPPTAATGVCNVPCNSYNENEEEGEHQHLTQFVDCSEASTSSSAFIATGGGGGGYSTRLFYGSTNAVTGQQPPPQQVVAQHKSVIVSPQSQRNQNQQLSTAMEDTPLSNDQNHSADNDKTAEDVGSLMSISSHETKKARRVQKTARCLSGSSSGKRK
ncbi:F-box protein dampened [Musca autumnalis]|uniref:F-box protein dampened n=1 Tax=Musca autumnalis TaxID=221902 RepID=UPI003CEC8498